MIWLRNVVEKAVGFVPLVCKAQRLALSFNGVQCPADQRA